MEHKELGTICDEHEDDIQDLIEFYRTVAGGVSTLVKNPNVPQDQMLLQLQNGGGGNVITSPVKASLVNGDRQSEDEEEEDTEEEVEVEEEEEVSAYETGEDTENDTGTETEEDIGQLTDDDPEWSVSLSPSKKLDPLELETSQISRRLSSNGGGGSGSHEFGCPEEDCEWVCNRRQRLEKHLANKHGFSQEVSLCKTDEVVAAVQKGRTDRTGGSRDPGVMQDVKQPLQGKETAPTHIL